MSSSLLDSLTSLAGPNLINTAATRLGEQPQAVSHGLTASFGAILVGLVGKATDSDGFRKIFDLVRGNQHISEVLNNPAEFVSAATVGDGTGGTTNSVLNTGQQLLSSVLPGSVGSVTNLIAQASGLQSGSAASLMGLAAPLVMGVLGKRVHDQGLNAASFANLLTSEKDSILRAAPAGLGSLVGLTDMTREAAGRVVSGVSNAASTAPSMGRGWKWPLISVLAVLAVLWGILRCGREGSTVSNQMPATADTIARMGESAGKGIANAVTSATAALGAFVSRALPNGTTLNVPENGIESRLIGFISDVDRPVSDTVWFDFDRLLFQTGSATLSPESQEQLHNIATILQAYPNVNAKIGGYTDNQGNAGANLRLSQARADNVRKGLVGLGITANRLTAEGYGDAHPVADNSTEEGRARNRRIALRVTKK